MIYTCIILHNMIIKDQNEAISPDLYPEEAHQLYDLLRSDEQRHRLIKYIKSSQAHQDLRADLIEHLSPVKIDNIMSSDPNYEWEELLDIDDSDLPLTFFLRPCNNHVSETNTSITTQNSAGIVQVEENTVRIITGPAGIVQVEGKPKVVEDVGEDEDFKSGSWVSVNEYVNANGGIVSGCLRDIKNFFKNGKLEQVVAIIKSCSLKDLSGTIRGAIHHKVINEGVMEMTLM
nr:hypothetical protein [Tanacetum cinerariifolium]